MTTSLVRREAAYYYRQRVPLDLTARLGRRELRKSLGTRDPREARSRVVRVRARAEVLFDHLRRNPMLTEDECRFYARWWYQACLDEAFDWKQMADLHPEAAEINAGHLATRDRVEREIVRDLNAGDIGRVALHAEIALQEDGRPEDADPNEASFRRMCAYMLRGALEATRRVRAEERGDFGYETQDPLFKGCLSEPAPIADRVAAAPQVVPQAPEPTPSGPSLGDLIEPFVIEKARDGRVSEKTQADYRASLALFCQIVGADRPVAAITGPEVVEFKNLLLRCPTNFRKRMGIDDLREAVRLNEARSKVQRLGTLDPKTINEKYLSNLKSFFDWARDNRHITASPATGIRAQRPKKVEAVELRNPFSIEDLRRIFAAPLFTETPRDQWTHQQWVPLVGLYSGCRLNEIGQMRVEDIETLNGIPHFAIRSAEDQPAPKSEEERRRLKSAAARRWVPVHPDLVRLGFLDYARSVGKGRLFPLWGLSGDGYYSSAFSKWFSRFLVSVKVKTARTSFHSFRHTLADALDEVVERAVRDRFLGHASGHVGDRYGSKPPKQAWSEAFLRLAYPGLGLSN